MQHEMAARCGTRANSSGLLSSICLLISGLFFFLPSTSRALSTKRALGGKCAARRNPRASPSCRFGAFLLGVFPIYLVPNSRAGLSSRSLPSSRPWGRRCSSGKSIPTASAPPRAPDPANERHTQPRAERREKGARERRVFFDDLRGSRIQLEPLGMRGLLRFDRLFDMSHFKQRPRAPSTLRCCQQGVLILAGGGDPARQIRQGRRAVLTRRLFIGRRSGSIVKQRRLLAKGTQIMIRGVMLRLFVCQRTRFPDFIGVIR